MTLSIETLVGRVHSGTSITQKREAADKLHDRADEWEAIINAGGFQALVDLTRNGSNRGVGRVAAAEALERLAEKADSSKIAEVGGIQALVDIARDCEQCRPHAARALGYLAENGAENGAVRKIVEADGIEALVDLARVALTRGGGYDVGWSAAMALSKLARFAGPAEKIMEARGIQALVALTSCEWHCEREYAAWALGNLAVHGLAYCTAIKEADGDSFDALNKLAGYGDGQANAAKYALGMIKTHYLAEHIKDHGFKEGRDASPAASEESQPAKRLKAEAEAEAEAEAKAGQPTKQDAVGGASSSGTGEAEAEAEQKEAVAARAGVASTSGAQQMQTRLEKVHQLMLEQQQIQQQSQQLQEQSQQLQQQSQQLQQQSQQLQQQSQQIMAGAIEEVLNGMASGSVAEVMAAASAYAKAIAARKAVTDCYAARLRCYAEKEEAIRAENSKLEKMLREVEVEPPQGPGFEKTKEAMEEARKEIAEWECMTRGRYARHLRSLLGDDAIDGQDVFHIIAESNGGANHPDNFLYALGSTFNRSIGNNFDDFNAFLAGKEKTERAVRASINYGNRTKHFLATKNYDPIAAGGSSSDPADEARRLFAKGQQLMTAARKARRDGQA